MHPNFIYDVLHSGPVHGQVDNLATGFFPTYDLTLPAHIRLEAKVTAPSLHHVGQALLYTRVAPAEKHLPGSEGPGYQTYMGGDPLVPLRSVAQTQN